MCSGLEVSLEKADKLRVQKYFFLIIAVAVFMFVLFCLVFFIFLIFICLFIYYFF